MKAPVLLVLLVLAINAVWAADNPKSKATIKAQNVQKLSQVQPPPAPPEKLVANAIICESVEELGLLSADRYKVGFKGKNGKEIYEQVTKTNIPLNKALMNVISIGINTNEKLISIGGRPWEVANYQRELADQREKLKKLNIDQETLTNFQERCIATSDAEEEVTVLEVKAISGLVKVLAMVKGSSAEVWTKNEYLVGRQLQN